MLIALIKSHVCGPDWDGFTGKTAEKSFLFPGRQGVFRVFCLMPVPLTARSLNPVKFSVPLKIYTECCLKMLNIKIECKNQL